MRTGILGGTFNPPHFGHLHIAKEAIDLLALERVLFIPSGEHPLKKSREIAAAKDRLAMTKLATDHEPRFNLCDIEIKRSSISYSVETLAELAKTCPEHELIFMVGSDILTELHLWKDWQKILDHAHLVVMVRPGVEVGLSSLEVDSNVGNFLKDKQVELPEQLDVAKNGFYQFLHLPVTPVDISATQIRELIKSRASSRGYTPDGVVDYIEQNRLYLT
ncbi:MAG: nicotinate (nicotinamide) nucleotide adenylyltransferase [Magnetococcales bacterium]|nr:nicotinate (nicotinamide) nucleotide adenylyltransferase [Magnetococcales bacterium]